MSLYALHLYEILNLQLSNFRSIGLPEGDIVADKQLEMELLRRSNAQ